MKCLRKQSKAYLDTGENCLLKNQKFNKQQTTSLLFHSSLFFCDHNNLIHSFNLAHFINKIYFL